MDRNDELVHATLNTDGGSRGNPGPAGIGFTLVFDDGLTYRGGCFIGETSNNVAEYNALLWGLENAKAAKVEDLSIRADSELMVNQVRGTYRVKNEGLKPLFAQVMVLLGAFKRFDIEHVYREKNSEADALANEAMDKRATVGEFLRKPAVKQSLFDLASAPDITDPEPAIPSDVFIDELISGEETAFATRDDEPVRQPVVQDDGYYELTVKDHFDAAHSLTGYPGQCANLHGHTWDVEVSIEGTELDEIGILYDFKTLKRDLAAILANFDHKYLNDVALFDGLNSTAENMARIIFEQLEKKLPEQVTLTEVCVWESPIARLRYRKSH